MKTLNIKWLWVLGGLLFLNLSLLLYILLNKNGSPGRQPPRVVFEETLDFSPDQREQFEILKKEHQQMMVLKNQQIRKLKDKLFTNLGVDNTSNQAKELAVKVGILVSEIDLETRMHFEEVRAICNDDQKAKFDITIQEMLRPQGLPGGVQGPPPMRTGSGRPGVNGPPPPMEH
jgi:protein CpxP